MVKTKPRVKSILWHCSILDVGESHYFEAATPEAIQAIAARVAAKTRYAESMQGMSFTSQRMIGIPCDGMDISQAVYILKVKRLT